MIDYKRLPRGVTSFRDFIDKSKIYVDKTDLLAKIAQYEDPVFLSRPRRFGKSTLVNTFAELFSSGLEKFSGLKIAEQDLWHDGVYPVLHLDFSEIKEYEGAEFERELFFQLLDACGEKEQGDAERLSPGRYLKDFLARRSGERFVLLIDEYDAPLTADMDNKAVFEGKRKVLSNFFATVKRFSGRFRFIFITGVARYSNTSIFSAFNELLDITFDANYGALTGYTHSELELYFKDYLENAAAVLNEKYGESRFDYASLLEELKRNYDGYCFDEEARHEVYNPWSILNFLRMPEKEFEPYWLQSGGNPELLVNYLNLSIERQLKTENFADYLDLDKRWTTSKAKLSPNITSIESGNFPFLAVLYQTGYLTIKKRGVNYLEVGIPNLEVKQSFAEIIVQQLTAKGSEQLSSLYHDAVAAALRDGNWDDLKAEFNKIINEFSYESIRFFNEQSFRDIFKLTLQLIGFSVYTEYQTALGRSDLTFEDAEHLYICEFKVTADASQAERRLAEAKAQLSERRYAVRLTPKKVTALAVVIVNQEKTADAAAAREITALEEI